MHLISKIAVAMYFVKSGSSPGPLFVLRSPVLWGIAGIAGGVYLFFRGFPFLKRKHLIQDIPTSTVRGAPLGAVELSGTVEVSSNSSDAYRAPGDRRPEAQSSMTGITRTSVDGSQ